MSILGSNEKDGLELEKQIADNMMAVVSKFRELASREDEFLQAVEQGSVNPEKFKINLNDAYIELEQDVEEPLKEIDEHIQKLRAGKGPQSNLDEDVANELVQAFTLLEKEEQRFKELIAKAEQHEEKQDISEMKAAEKIDDFERNELSQKLKRVENAVKDAESQLNDDLQEQMKN